MNDEQNLYEKIREFETTTVNQVIEMEKNLQLTMRDFVFQSDAYTALARRVIRKGAAKLWPDLPVRVQRIEEISDYIRYRYLPFVRPPWWRVLFVRRRPTQVPRRLGGAVCRSIEK